MSQPMFELWRPRECVAGDDEVSIRAGAPSKGILKVIEWHHLNPYTFLPATMTSTLSVRIGLYPLNVMRARLQLQKQKTVYRNTFHAFSDIVKTEGIGGLYRGFWVSFPQIGCSLIYTLIYEQLRVSLKEDYGITSAATASSISGAAASFCTQAIFVPTDILSQYMMVYYHADKFISGNDRAIVERLKANAGRYSLGRSVVRAVRKEDGLRGFYRGFLASCAVYVPYCAVFWPTYYWMQDGCQHAYPLSKRPSWLPGLWVEQLVSAAMAGVVATTVTNPTELLRIRAQIHRTSYPETIARIIRNEGWTVFTKGLGPRLVTNSIQSCVVMVGYEAVKRWCILPQYADRVKW